MNILRIYLRLPPKSGGMERHIAFLSQEQFKAGHDVVVIYNSGESILPDDIQVCPFTELSKLKPAFLGIFIFYVAVIYNIISKGIRADVVHIHGDWGHLCLAGLIKKLVKARCLAFSVHGDLSRQGLRYNLLRYFIKPVDVVYSTGYLGYQTLLSFVKVPCYFQPSGIDQSLIERAQLFNSQVKSLKSIRPKILSVCNYKKVKNIDFMIELASKMQDCDFEIVGEGEERARLQSRIDSLNLGNFYLVGEKYTAQLADCYEMADIFLLTSFREGTPTALLEALAFGLPVVTSNAGGVSHLFQDYPQVKVLFDFDIQTYEAAIRTLLSSSVTKPSETNRFGWASVANFITERYVNEGDLKS